MWYKIKFVIALAIFGLMDNPTHGGLVGATAVVQQGYNIFITTYNTKTAPAANRYISS